VVEQKATDWLTRLAGRPEAAEAITQQLDGATLF
jgi:hypothetical protein